MTQASDLTTADESYDKFWALRNLPPFPAIATKLLQLLSHDEAETSAVVSLIRADAAFSSELLRVANSQVYGLRSQVGSIHHAVVILGFNAVKTLALTIAMKNFLRAAMRIDLLRRVWRHSLACALIAEELSAACSKLGERGHDDRIYTAGLLHDIGRLGLLVRYPPEYANLLAVVVENPFDILDTERQLFDLDHCQAGGWLAEQWKFPTEIQDVAAHHHDPPRPGQSDVADIVRASVLLADSLGFDVVSPRHTYTMDEIRALLPHPAQYRFNADPTDLKAQITEKRDAFD